MMQSISSKKIQISGNGGRHQFDVSVVVGGVANALRELRDQSGRVNTQSLQNTSFMIGENVFKADATITTYDHSDPASTVELKLHKYALLLNSLGLFDHHNNQQSKIDVARDQHDKDTDAFEGIAETLLNSDVGDHIATTAKWLGDEGSGGGSSQVSLDASPAESWFPPVSRDIATPRELATEGVQQLAFRFTEVTEEAAAAEARATVAEARATVAEAEADAANAAINATGRKLQRVDKTLPSPDSFMDLFLQTMHQNGSKESRSAIAYTRDSLPSWISHKITEVKKQNAEARADADAATQELATHATALMLELDRKFLSPPGSFLELLEKYSDTSKLVSDVIQELSKLRDQHDKDTDAFERIAEDTLQGSSIPTWLGVVSSDEAKSDALSGSSHVSLEAQPAGKWLPYIPDEELTTPRELATEGVQQLAHRFTQVKKDAAAAEARAAEAEKRAAAADARAAAAEAAAANALESAKNMSESSFLALGNAEKLENKVAQLTLELQNHRASSEGGGV